MATVYCYGQGLANIVGGTAGAYTTKINYMADTIKAMLVTASYTPDLDAHDFINDVTNEVVGTGYSAGGLTLTNKTLTVTGATNTIKFDADDLAWAGASISAAYCVIYDDTATNKPLLWLVDLGGTQTVVNTTFTVAFSVNGISTISY